MCWSSIILIVSGVIAAIVVSNFLGWRRGYREGKLFAQKARGSSVKASSVRSPL